MSVRVKDMCAIVQVPMSATYELSSTHIDNTRVGDLHFAVLQEIVEHLGRDS